MEFIRLLLAFLIPPLAVYLQFGVGKRFWLNVVLTVCGFMPGMVHAVYIMTARPPGLIRREKMESQNADPNARQTASSH